MERPIIICLTPVRNDEWVIERFLKAASLWADYIIIADQNSADRTSEIATSFSKVILVNNDSAEYNELGRKRLLINEARKIKGEKLLIALDVDEMFSPEIFTSGEWEKVLQLPKGTAINFQWSNFAPDGRHMWKGYYFPWGYMDDGFEEYDKGISSDAIHCARVPITENTPGYDVHTFSVIHFQYTDWDRMVHKHYYYQCLEVINNPGKSAVDIYRQYHHMDSLKKEEFIEIPSEWIEWYKSKGIDILEVKKEDLYWYDKEVIKLFDKYGPEKFKKVSLWSIDWSRISKLMNYEKKYKDPRSIIDVCFQKLIAGTQTKQNRRFYRRIDRIVKMLY